MRGTRLFLVLFVCAMAFSQVMVNLRQPPPGMWNIEEMWSLSLTNTISDDTEVYLRGTADELRRGRIYEATSAAFTLPAGRMVNVTRSMLDPVDMNYEDTELSNILERTGELPEGDYTICVYAHNAATREEVGHDCYMLNIAHTTPPELTSPEDGSSIAERLPVFMWLPPMPIPRGGVSYDLRVVELVGGQIPEEAIASNPAFFEEDGIMATSFQYPMSAREFDPEGVYAWQVTASTTAGRSLATSQVWSFSYMAYYGVQIDSCFLQCLSPGSYTYVMYLTNPNSGPSELVNHAISSILPTTPPLSPVISPTPDPGSSTVMIPAAGQLTISGTITTSGSATKICIVNQLQDPLNSYNFASRDTCFEPIVCPNCCDGFEMDLSDFTISLAGSGDAYILGGNLTAGPESICKIEAQIVNFKYTYSDSTPPGDGCRCIEPCIWPASAFGNFTKPATIDGNPGDLTNWTVPGTGAPLFDYSREIIWEASSPTNISGTPFQFGLVLPNAGCCEDRIQICIRFAFTNSECVTCDTVVSISFTRCPLSPVDLSYNMIFRHLHPLPGGNSLDGGLAFLRPTGPEEVSHE